VRPNWTAGLRLGIDDYHENRNFDVSEDWKGGYPTALGRGDFSGGGSQRQKLSSGDNLVQLTLNRGPHDMFGFQSVGTVGIERRSSNYRMSTAITDKPASGAAVPSTGLEKGNASTNALFGLGTWTRGPFGFDWGARLEQSSTFEAADDISIYPSFGAFYDLAQRVKGLQTRLSSATVRAGFWRAGNEITPRTLASTFAGQGTTLGVATTNGGISGPERTTGLELGAELTSVSRRHAIGFTAYRERSTQLLLGLPGASGGTPAQEGEVFNGGFEVQLRTTPMDNGPDSRWQLTTWLAKNSSTVDKLTAGLSQIALGPDAWGTQLVARVGEPLGTIVGSRYLRDANGQLLLANGLPIADQSQSFVLGSIQPDWSASVGSRLRMGAFEVGLLLDARVGGHVYSATNRWGSYAGTLEATAAGGIRENPMVLAGIVTATDAANSTGVSAQDYFHALGAISEPWVYDASYAKLRETRLTYERPLTFMPGFSDQVVRVSFVARNLLTWAKAPNIDPETAYSVGVFQGFEMGQLPSTRSIGIQLSIAP